MLNCFSDKWYETFLDPIPAELTASELALVGRHLPAASFPHVVDLCCGPGRHAAGLAERGYRVLGVDVNSDAVARARAAVPTASFEVLDMRRIDSLPGSFDAVLNLWHSFGYFDDATNEDVVRQIHAKLRPGGRALIDVYNRDHFRPMPAFETGERNGVRFETRRAWNGPRLRVTLSYDSGDHDELEFRLYTPAEFRALCVSIGFEVLLSCAWFKEELAPSAEHARMQFLLERPPAT